MEKEKKEIGMEKEIELNIKLHNLFKEYIENYGGDAKSTDSLDYVVIDDGQAFLYGQRRYLYETLISKKFGMVKWLVEKDKIDKRKIDTRLVRNVESHYDEDGYWVENSYEDYSNTDTLLMLLSISDTPIEDLLLYLK